MNKKELELYIHIPFCVRKCSYCDFLSAPATEQTREAYMAALFAEIGGRAKDYSDRTVTSIFIGGGTPSLLSGEQIGQLMDRIREQFAMAQDAEITMEVNPGTASAEKLRNFYTAGINRLSIGMQSAQAEELKNLGRIHDFEGFCQVYREAVEAGFTNINVDIMSGLPGQTLASYRDTLEKVLHLEPMPQHISAYSLIVEEGTPFAAMAERGELPLPEEETERAMYEETIEVLAKYGFHRYEISNYAKPQKECKHNLRYWERGEYLGIGLGSASLIQNMRMNNTREMSEYLEKSAVSKEMRKDVEFLENRQQIEEFMFLGLRKTYGVSKKEFHRAFGRELEDVYGQTLKKFIEEGMIKEKKDRIFLTEDGVLVSNQILSEFLF